ncbi:FAD:protein FMN transferase [Planctomycetota bacterium]
MSDLSQHHRFSHQAMTTTFEILIDGHEEKYAAQAATEAFDVLNRLEAQLSRYRESSDVTQLNQAPVNTPVLLSLETFACLEQARQLFEWTDGLFDVTVGRWTHETPASGKPAKREAFPMTLNVDELTGMRLLDDVAVDLGGIGKGFALDILAQHLAPWQVTQALLHSGGSTALALDAPSDTRGWPLTISDPHDASHIFKRFNLKNSALAGSAQIERNHIVTPTTGGKRTRHSATWALAPTGALADGLSTAFTMMKSDAIRKLCDTHPGLGGAIIEGDEVFTVHGLFK